MFCRGRVCCFVLEFVNVFILILILVDFIVKDLIGGFIVFYYAVMYGRVRIVRLMLEFEYRSDIINVKSNDGWIFFYVVVYYGRDLFVRFLLEFKVEVDLLSDKGITLF